MEADVPYSSSSLSQVEMWAELEHQPVSKVEHKLVTLRYAMASVCLCTCHSHMSVLSKRSDRQTHDDSIYRTQCHAVKINQCIQR